MALGGWGGAEFCYPYIPLLLLLLLLLQGTGGPDCDFVPSRISDYYITLESLQSPGSHLGALPSGQITAPAQTTKATEVAQFSIVFVVCMSQGLPHTL